MLFELKYLEKKFEIPGCEKQLVVINGINLSVEQGESIAIVGPSGSGKSTLLNILGALDKPTSGIANFNGKDLTKLDENKLAKIRNQEIGFIFQLHHLLPQCSVLENVLIPTIPLKLKNKNEEFISRAKNLLEKVGLEKHFDYFPAQLSGGEQQRVAVVRALINQPKLILADEPTGSLDKSSAENLGKILIDLNKSENVTLIIVTHSIDLAKRMEKIYSLENGLLTLIE
jgi:lipoprotein-releasing system ATP-binding protein